MVSSIASSLAKRWGSQLVSTVTASKVGAPRPAAPAPSRAPAWAAASASLPAQPWTVINSAPRRAALRQAPAMVAGMSWNLRSRNTLKPRSRSWATTWGPAALNSSRPTFTQRSPGIAAARARAEAASGRSRARIRASAGCHRGWGLPRTRPTGLEASAEPAVAAADAGGLGAGPEPSTAGEVMAGPLAAGPLGPPAPRPPAAGRSFCPAGAPCRPTRRRLRTPGWGQPACRHPA